jgi:hypothetical protein
MNRLIAVALALWLPFATGCGVIFGGTRQRIQVNSTPPGATINTNPPAVAFTAPTLLYVPRNEAHLLTFSMPGYAEQKVQLQRDMRVGILVADILLTGLIGVIVDAATGAWYKLSPETVSVNLQKQGAHIVGPDTITVTVTTKDGDRSAIRVESSVPGVAVEVE